MNNPLKQLKQEKTERKEGWMTTDEAYLNRRIDALETKMNALKGMVVTLFELWVCKVIIILLYMIFN